MEINNEVKKNKKKFPISLIIGLAVVIVCAGVTIGTIIYRNVATSRPIELTEQMEATDEETLRKLLAANGVCTITLKENVIVSEELDVNGTKTLVGEHSIVMNTSNIGTSESVCAIQSGAELILDGVTIDGNGVVNGIAVKAGGTFTSRSGQVIYGYPYGVSVAGIANIENIVIDEAMHTGIYVEYGGDARMTGGVIQNNLYGVAVASQASMEISGDSVVKGSNGILISNYGKLDITGGKFIDAFDNAITNQGELTIKGTKDKMVEIGDIGRSAIVSKKNSKLTVEYLYMHDLSLHAIDVEKDSDGDIRNCVAKNAGKSCFYINNSKVYMKDVEISDCKSYAIYGTKGSNVELEDITVDNVENRGIVNDAAKMTAKNVVIKNTKKNAFHTMGEGAITKIEKLEVITPNSNAIAAVTGGNVNAKTVTIEQPKNEGLYIDSTSKIEIEDVTINNSGMTSVANNGGTLAARNITINASKNIGIKTSDGGNSAVRGAVIKDTASHALAVEKGSTLTVSDCKMDKVGWDKVKSAVYISKSKLTMKNSELNDVASYGIYVVNGGNTTERETYLENVKITKVGTTNGHRGIANVDSRIALKDVEVSNVTGAGIYTKGATSVTNMNGVSVSDTKGPALGFTAGTVNVKNTEVEDIENDGVHVGKEAKVRLDNIVIENVKGQGVGNYGGVVNITADKEWNTANTEEIGAKITITGKSGIYSQGGTSTVKNTTVINAKEHAVCLKKNSDAIINQCTFDTTEKAAVYVLESKLNIKKSNVSNAGSYGIYVEKSAKADDKVVNIENVEVSKAGNRGIANIDSYVVVKNSKVVASKGAGVYTSGVNAITLMNEVVAEDTGASGFALTGGEVQARNITITNSKNEGIYVGKDANVKNLDNVTIKDAGTDGIKNEGGTVHITVNKTYNPENIKENGVTIVNPGRIGIWNTGAATLTGKNVVIQDTVRQGILIDKDASVVLNNASILSVDGKEQDGINCSGTLTINEGGVLIDDVSGHGIYVGKTGNIVKASNVTIKNAAKKGLNVYGKVTEAKNLTIANTGEHAVQVATGGDATILGFDISKANSAKTTSAVVYAENAKLTMKNGQINNAYASAIYVKESENCAKEKVVLENIQIEKPGKYGVYNEGSFVNVTDVTVTDSKDDGIYTKGTNAVVNMKQVDVTNAGNRGIAIAGGTVVGTNLTIENAKTQSIKIGNKANLTIDSTVLTNNVKDLSDNHGILNDNGTVIIAADAKEKGLSIEGVNGCGIYNMNGSVSGKYVEINSVGTQGIYVEAGLVDLDETTVNNASGHGVSLYGESAKATFGNLAINDANKNGIYVEDGTLKSTGTITIDGKVTGNTAVTGEGLYVKGGKANIAEITVVDTKAQGLHFAKSSAGNVADVTIEGFDVSSTNLSSSNAVVYVENAKATLKNGTINAKNTREGATTYGINITEITKATEEMVVIENVTISETGKYGVYNNGSWVEMSEVTVEKSTDDAIYVTGANAVVNMDTVNLTELSNRGLVVAGGAVTGKNVSITEFKNEGIKLVSGTSLSLDNATIVNENKNSSNNKAGILNEGGTLTITADNQAANGATIKNVTGDGIKVNNNGKVNATNVTVMNASGCGIYNEKGGTAETPNVYKNAVIDNVGKFGVYVQAGQTTLDNVDIKNVTGTERDGIKSDATLVITNGVTISGVTDSYGINVTANGKMTADTILISNASKSGLYVDGGEAGITGKLTVANIGEQAVVSKNNANVSIVSFDEMNSVNTSNTYEETVLVENAKLTLKNGTINTGNNYGIKVTESTKPTEKKVVLENVTINTPSKYGVYNNGSWVEMSGVTVVNSADDSINAEGADSVTDMSNVTLTNPGKRGLYLAAGTSDINGISITGAEDCAMQIGPSVIVGNLYNISINGADAGEERGGKHGIYVEDEALVQDAKNISISNMAQKGLYMKKGNATQSVINTLVINNVYEQGIQFGYGANVKVTGFEVSNSNSKDGSNAAVYVHDNSKNVLFENGTINAVKNGITLANNSELVATNVQIIRANETSNTKTLVSVGAGTKFTLNENNGKSLIGKETESHTAYEGRGVEVSGEFVLNGGTITGNKITNGATSDAHIGAGVLVNEGAKFRMNGGTISYNIADGTSGKVYGSAVAVNGGSTENIESVFFMTGGSIKNNNAIKGKGAYGAGVSLNGSNAKFEMSGGDISDNGNTNLNAGGAVSINGGSTFSFSGGKIQRNIANNGGAIHANSGSMTMSGNALIGGENGGASCGNTAQDNGGAIWFSNGSFMFTMRGGQITHNSATNKGGGLFLSGKGTVKIVGGEFSDNSCKANYVSAKDIYANDSSKKGTLIFVNGYDKSTVKYNGNFNVSEITE